MPSTNLTNDPLENPKHRDFAARIAAGESQRQARDNAGLGNSTIRRLMRDQKVLDYIYNLRQQYLEEIDVSQQDVLRGFLDAVNDAKLLSDPATQIAGWREIGKFQGLYAPDRKEVNVTGSVEHVEKKISRMSNQELMDYMERLDNGEEPIDIEDAEWEEVSSPDQLPDKPATSAEETSTSRPSQGSSQKRSQGESQKSAPSAESATPKKKRKNSGESATSGGSRKRKSNAGNEQGSGSSSTRS